MLISRRNLREHLPWIIATLAVTVIAIFWFVAAVAGHAWERRPKGSDGALFIFGIAGGAICLFEFLLWPRKKYRTLRVGPVVVWMRAHIWLGLVSVPLLVLHSGFWFKNLEATLLLLLFLVVIASGVWGLILQQFLPQKMLTEVPAETIYSQIDYVSGLLHEEAERLVEGTCGTEVEAAEAEDLAAVTHFTVGAVRDIGGIQGKVLSSRGNVTYVANAETLRAFFVGELSGYLKQGEKSGSRLADARKAHAAFDELRLALDPRAHEAVASLENLAEQRRQFDRQAKLHWWLHSWLWVHLPLSIALILLMFVHVFKTLQMWWPS